MRKFYWKEHSLHRTKRSAKRKGEKKKRRYYYKITPAKKQDKREGHNWILKIKKKVKK